MHDVSCGGQLRHARNLQVRRLFQPPTLDHVMDFTPYPVSRRTPRHVSFAGSCAGEADAGQARTAVPVGRLTAFTSGRPVTPETIFGLGLGMNASLAFAPPRCAPSARCAVRVHRAAAAANPQSPLAMIVDNSVDDSSGGGFPYDGTVSKIRSHPTGAAGVVRGRWALSTGRLVHRQRMDLEDHVLPAQSGVRYGVRSGPMQTQKTGARVGSGALTGALGR